MKIVTMMVSKMAYCEKEKEKKRERERERERENMLKY